MSSPAFKSKLEQWAWGVLSKLKGKHKFDVTYESETLPYVLVKSYKPDFILTFKNGRKMYLETKGYLRTTDRTKLLSVLKSNPSVDIRLVFSVDNKLSKRSPTRYSEWCNKHNIPYAIGSIPKEWFNE